MRRKLKKNRKINLKSILIILFLYVLISIIYNGKIINVKNIILDSSLNFMINDESYLLKLLDFNIKTPKNILYSNLFLKTNNDELSYFYENDNEDTYSTNNSVYVEETNNYVVSEPIVYIYNTHQLEEYSSLLFNSYNIVPNVMIAAYTLREKLLEKGISALVETGNIKEYLNNNNLNYDYSYDASRYFMKNKLENNKNIKYIIDIHRDAIPKNLSTLNYSDSAYAKVLFVVGTDHENFNDNLSFATRINEKLEYKIKGLSRGIMKRNYRYNQDMNKNAILLELGGYENTIDEVYNTLNIFTEVFYEIIKEDENGKEKEN